MKKILIRRILSNKNKTLSEGMIMDDQQKLFEFKGIELPWRDNKPRVSCIPANLYQCTAVRRSSNGKYAILIHDVPGRSEIMIHTGNYARQLLGCLAPGREFADIDKDGIIDVTSSRATMDEIQKHIPLGETCWISIIDAWRVIGNLDPKSEKRV